MLKLNMSTVVMVAVVMATVFTTMVAAIGNDEEYSSMASGSGMHIDR